MQNKWFFLIFLFSFLISSVSHAQDNDSITIQQSEPVKKKAKWYEKFSFGGYTQIRYNRLLETNPKLNCDQCDKSWGEGGSIFLRRARIKFSGNVHERVYAYIQIDGASDLSSSAASSNLSFLQLRDIYFDIYLDDDREFRIRPGLSKVPFGFENLQSSQHRIPIDRADPLNTAVPNERDLGVFFYWTPKKIQEHFETLKNQIMKGTGDYGVFGLGVYTGQTARRTDRNDNLHVVSRLTYPFKVGDQFIEPSVFAYTGYINIVDWRSSDITGPTNFKDERIGASLTVYPRPFGIQAEYNVGKSPAFNRSEGNIILKDLYGGYLQAMYAMKIKEQDIIFYGRGQYYNGGKKHELDATYHLVKELEFGIEWQPFPAFEFVAAYVMADRSAYNLTDPDYSESGNLLRLQLQINY